MPCPYCDSSNWDIVGVLEVDYQCDFVIVYRTCICNDCRENFVMTQEYVETDDYEYLTMEEWHESE